MIIGGSLGAAAVNDAVRAVLPELLKTFQVIHLCGKGKLDESLKNTNGYVPVSYTHLDVYKRQICSSFIYSTALRATFLGYWSKGRFSSSPVVQTFPHIVSVGISANGSTVAVSGSGINTISLFSIGA